MPNMTLATFFTLQIIAHILTDFIFQTDKLAQDKNAKGFKSSFLIWHGLIAFLSSWLLSFQLNFIIGALIIGLLHYIIDGLKPFLNRSSLVGNFSFFIDQLLHFVVFIVTSILFFQISEFNTLIDLSAITPILPYALALLICTKPANIIIKEVFSAYSIEVVPQKNELEYAGRLIGVLERLLVLLFIWIGEFEAVGFLIAAKSILRYKDTDLLKTEYVLIGTMLSFGIATVSAMLAYGFNYLL